MKAPLGKKTKEILKDPKASRSLFNALFSRTKKNGTDPTIEIDGKKVKVVRMPEIDLGNDTIG